MLLHDALKYIDKRKTTIVPNGFGKWWLGNLVTRLGGNWEDYPCRGDITSYSLENETSLMIWQNTAWGEQEGVRKIIEEKLPSIKVYFQEEEPGCQGVFPGGGTGMRVIRDQQLRALPRTISVGQL